MPAAPLGRRRPRPVADVPPLDAHELAHAWLVALVAAAPLNRAAELPGHGFAIVAPRLCEALLAALSSDAALDELHPGGARAGLAADAAQIAGAGGPAAAVTALDALRATTWSALVTELRDPPPSQITDLADRLGSTIAALTAAVLDQAAPTAPPADRAPLTAGPPATAAAPPTATDPRSTADPRAEASHPPAGAPRPADPHPPAVDPRASAAPPPTADPHRPGVQDGATFHARVAPWTAAVERRLQRHAEDGLPFALLCVEVADLDRLVASERDGDIAIVLEAAEAAVCAQLRPADVLVRERPGRYWLVAPETDADAARSLAHLLAASVAAVPGHRGAPLEAAIGVAVCPADGMDGAALEGRAEEGLFAARAAGLRVAGSPR